MVFNSYRPLGLGRPDLDLVGERPVDRAHDGDLYEPLSLRLVEMPLQMDLAVDFVEHSRFRLAVLAVSCMNTSVAKPYFHAF